MLILALNKRTNAPAPFLEAAVASWKVMLTIEVIYIALSVSTIQRGKKRQIVLFKCGH